MKEKVLELLENEWYDICDAYEPVSVALLVEELVLRIKSRESDECLGSVVSAQLGSSVFKVNNSLNGFVSCSDVDEGCTGVSNTLYYPYYEGEDNDGLKNLLEMVNEAWYAADNCNH